MSTYAPESGSGGFVEENREFFFVTGLLVGVTIFALGFAFFLLSATTDTTPPSPYFATTTDQILLIAISVVALVIGGGITRWAMRLAGW